MQLKELIQNRYSVRAYLPVPVEREKVDYILECARLSPSACNLQPWIFYVITEPGLKQGVEEAYSREWIRNAPLYIIVCKDTAASWKRAATDGKDFGDVDAAIAAQHICLAAAETGLGTCWICNFDSGKMSKALSLPAHIEPIVLFPIGYIDDKKSSRPAKVRKPLSDTTEWR